MPAPSKTTSIAYGAASAEFEVRRAVRPAGWPEPVDRGRDAPCDCPPNDHHRATDAAPMPVAGQAIWSRYPKKAHEYGPFLLPHYRAWPTRSDRSPGPIIGEAK